MAPEYLHDFDDVSTAGNRELLGGKGVGLAEMTQIGVPVPAGFTITTDACRAYMAAGKRLPDGLEDEMAVHVERRPEMAGPAAAAAGAQLGTRIKDRIGVSVSVLVMDPDSIERSAGKMRRIVDHRKG